MLLTTEKQYEDAVTEAKAFFDIPESTMTEQDDARLSDLAAAIEAYEAVHYPAPELSEDARNEVTAEMERVYGRRESMADVPPAPAEPIAA